MIFMPNFEDYERMAMLDLSDTERAHLRARFDEIVSGFSVLDAYDTDGVESLVTVLDLQNIMREDIALETISRDELLENAPEQHDGYFRAPSV